MRLKYALLLLAIISAIAVVISLFSGKSFTVKNLADPKGREKAKPSSLTGRKIEYVTDNNFINKSESVLFIPDEIQLLPVEWEESFLEIMTKPDQSMDQRNTLLIDFAINKAVGVEAVQEECLRHLAYGLQSNQKEDFEKIITAPSIPIEIRKRFLGHLFAMNRNDDFITWLCVQVRICGHAELITFSRSRVQNFDEL